MKEEQQVLQNTTMEEVFTRFPHLGQQIFEKLDDDNLAKCRKVSRTWKMSLDNQKLLSIRIIQNLSENPVESLEKMFMVYL